MTEEKELNEKLARWAGFKRTKGLYGPWKYPTEISILPMDRFDVLPDFTSSLDVCFKWLVPKLIGCKLDYKGVNPKMEWFASVEIYYANTEGQTTSDEYDTNPALALCRAIEKLIDEH